MELYQHANIISGQGLSAEVLVVTEGWAVVVPDVVLGNCDSIQCDFDCGQKKVICPESENALKVNVNECLGLHIDLKWLPS